MLHLLIQILKYSNTDDLFEYMLNTSAAIELVDRKAERGAMTDGRRSKSLLARWLSKPTTTCSTMAKDKSNDSNAEFVIKRDTLLLRAVKRGRAKNSSMMTYN